MEDILTTGDIIVLKSKCIQKTIVSKQLYNGMSG